MSDKKDGMLPKVELIIIVVFLLSFMGWAVTRCSATKNAYQAESSKEDDVQAFMDSIEAQKELDTLQSMSDIEEAPIPEVDVNQSGSRTILYVTIEGLKLRESPNLKAEILGTLSLFEEVQFMNEYTDFKEEINLGRQVVSEPWIKVRSRKGKVGWVYGAGVHYYKYKHPGVL